MNRELKFKGWNGKRMTREFSLKEMLSTQLEHNGLKELWLQWTGLRDRKGVEIYEGDMLFYTIATNRGDLQFVAYNEHNGYYAHDVVIVKDSKIVEQESI